MLLHSHALLCLILPSTSQNINKKTRKMTVKWPKNGPKMVKRPQNDARTIPKWPQNDTDRPPEKWSKVTLFLACFVYSFGLVLGHFDLQHLTKLVWTKCHQSPQVIPRYCEALRLCTDGPKRWFCPPPPPPPKVNVVGHDDFTICRGLAWMKFLEFANPRTTNQRWPPGGGKCSQSFVKRCLWNLDRQKRGLGGQSVLRVLSNVVGPKRSKNGQKQSNQKRFKSHINLNQIA